MNKNRLGPNGTQKKISLKIRRDIRTGVYSPGEKLPSRIELEERYNSSPVTVQKAFDKLREDGYIYSDVPKGTFVADHPPCFSNYAIVFPHHLRKYQMDVSFYSILIKLAQGDKTKQDCYFTVYTGLNGHIDEPGYIRLYDDVKADRLAGIIFATDPVLIKDTPLFKKIVSCRYLSKVAFMSENPYPEIPTIQFDFNNCISKIFNFLEEKAIKRIAVISFQEDVVDYSHFSTESEDAIFTEAEKRNIDLPKYDFQVRHPALAVRTSDISHLILKRDIADRPQALWIMNDALVEAATQGVVDAGLTPPDDLLVISHCNFPEKPKSHVQTSWYGLNVCKFINIALEVLKRQNRGEDVPDVTSIPTEYRL